MDSKTAKNLRCLIIGPLANHAFIGRVAAFAAAGYDIYLIDGTTDYVEWLANDYPIKQAKIISFLEDPYYREPSKNKRFFFEFLRIMGLLAEDRPMSQQISCLVKKYEIDFIVTHYGTHAIHFSRILKRITPDIPVINIINLVPSSINMRTGLSKVLLGSSGRIEMLSYRKWLKKIDGVIYANEKMKKYAADKLRAGNVEYAILPDYLPMAFYAKISPEFKQQERIINDSNPKVIFLGAPERYGSVIDSLDKEFMELAKANIHIFSATIAHDVIATGFGHYYPLMSNSDVFTGKLATFAAQFDAALVTYNIEQRHERFRTTFPTRLFSAISAGVPIAIRGGFFDACEEFVVEHQIGFVYDSAPDLRTKLNDRNLLQQCRINVRKKMIEMCAENQKNEIRHFVDKLINKNLL